MIDRGISEEYLAWWLEAWEYDSSWAERVESTLKHAQMVVQRAQRSGLPSLIQMYQSALTHYGGSEAIGAEWLRRALHELASPTPVDDGLPPADSPVWRWIYELIL